MAGRMAGRGTMTQELARAITEDEIRTYEEDGIVHLKGLFDADWVERLRGLVDEDMANPGKLCQELTKEGNPGRFFFDTFMWTYNDGFKQAVFESPAARIAASVMRSNKVNIFFDQLLIKEPGTTERTPWHHDMPYWPVVGTQICTVWLALDPVTAETGSVEYVKGSHRWGQRYRADAFAGDGRYKEDLPKVPDIDTMRDEVELLQFEFELGDCTAHHALLVHGAPGNARSDARRRAYVTRWAGADATYYPRENIQQMMWDPTCAPGAPLDSELWPVVIGEGA
ncbi:MAG: phytanoyl-CoA dioxygenase [Alphaproteobacteria bacterium]|nr:phytanoyl-CoA dioxygenase [Alphaproteobacteria bacterium]